MSGIKISREEYAKIEIGRTDISRSASVVLSVFFLIAVFLVPVAQYLVDHRRGTSIAFSFGEVKPVNIRESFFATIDWQNNSVLKNINLVETSLEDNSFLRKFFLPPMQYALLRYLG